VDFGRYSIVEPRLKEARWLDANAPYPGARATVVADIPFTAAIVERVVGPPHGIVELTAFEEGRLLAYLLTSDRALGYLHATFDQSGRQTRVVARGWIVPRRRAGRLAFVPVLPLLTLLTNRAVARGIRRAADAVGTAQAS
jgi:hypothetical protein